MSTEDDRRSGNDRRSAGDRRAGGDRRGGADRRAGEDRRRASDRRSEVRARKRIPCEVVLADRRHRAFVLDVSMHGLFVQTRSAIDPGTEIGVEFRLPGTETEIALRATVARHLRALPNLASVSASGVGLQITRAPSEYYEFLSKLTSTEPGANPTTSTRSAAPAETIAPVEPSAAKSPVEAEPHYRVQVKHVSGPRSRTLVVSATSREHAESQVLDELGDEWKIIHVEVA